MCVCVSSRSLWGGWADVGLWVAVYFLAKISLHRPTCKTTFARLTQSQAISQSFHVFITFRSMRDTTFFHFSKLFFCTKYRFFYHGDQKMSWWCRWLALASNQAQPLLIWWRRDPVVTISTRVGPGSRLCRWRAINFEIHLWSSGMNGADCFWRSISIQHVQIEPGVNSDPGNDSFWVEIRDKANFAGFVWIEVNLCPIKKSRCKALVIS